MTFRAAHLLPAVATMLALSAVAPASCHAQAAIREAGQVRFEGGFGGPAPNTWPSEAPAIRFYFTAGASAPSCGLFVAARHLVVPLLEPDEGADFPQCVGVPAALVLQQGSEHFYLLRIQQKDTREDSSQTDMLLVERKGLPVPLDDLASTSAPSGKPLSQVAAWLRARWVNQTQAQQGAHALPEHTATTPRAYLAIARLADGLCQFVLGAPERPAPGITVTKPCVDVKASSVFQQGAASWFVVLLESGGQGPQVLVFEVDAKSAREVPELAASLSTKAAEGKILHLRQALQKLVSERR